MTTTSKSKSEEESFANRAYLVNSDEKLKTSHLALFRGRTKNKCLMTCLNV